MTGDRLIPLGDALAKRDRERRTRKAARAGNESDRRPINASAPRFEIKMWSDVDHPVPPDSLVHKLLGAASLAALCGPPGCGKSFLAQAIALAIARAVDIFGRAVTRGAVLYVSAEGHGGFVNRLIAYRRHYGVTGAVPFAHIAAAPNLGPDGTDTDHIIAAARTLAERTKLAVALIIVDTVNRSLGGGDENSSADMGAFIVACDRIRIATGATVLVVHHTGKETARGMRGHSSLLGACDSVIMVERIAETAARTATVSKQKDGADGEKITFELRPVEIGTDDRGEPITSCVVVPTDAEPDAPTRRARPKLSPADKQCFDALTDTIARHGTPAPACNHIPASARIVSERLWRDAADKTGFSASDKPDSKRRAFKRSADSLATKGLVGKWTEFCWVIR